MQTILSILLSILFIPVAIFIVALLVYAMVTLEDWLMDGESSGSL